MNRRPYVVQSMEIEWSNYILVSPPNHMLYPLSCCCCCIMLQSSGNLYHGHCVSNLLYKSFFSTLNSVEFIFALRSYIPYTRHGLASGNNSPLQARGVKFKSPYPLPLSIEHVSKIYIPSRTIFLSMSSTSNSMINPLVDGHTG